MSRVRIPSPAFRSGTEGFASRPSLGADSLPSLREVSAAVLRTATGIRTSQSSVRIPSPALFVMLLNSACSLALMLQTRACCAAQHLMKVCTSVQTLKGSLAPIQSSLFIFFARSMTPMKPAMTSGTARIKQCIRGLGYAFL